jgi:hypothetical protein
MSCNCEDDKKPFTKFSLVNAGISVIKHFTDSTYNAFADEEIKKKRLDACNSCENLTEFLGKRQLSDKLRLALVRPQLWRVKPVV